MSIVRLQSGAWIHWRLYFHVDAIERNEPNAERGNVPQINWRLGLITSTFLNREEIETNTNTPRCLHNLDDSKNEYQKHLMHRDI